MNKNTSQAKPAARQSPKGAPAPKSGPARPAIVSKSSPRPTSQTGTKAGKHVMTLADASRLNSVAAIQGDGKVVAGSFPARAMRTAMRTAALSGVKGTKSK
jgi:hypothetical protein